jgi:RimJ/RimL family protein N-acetyltransferase
LLALIDPEEYQTPLAADLLAFIANLAFVERRWRKLLCQVLDTEKEYCDFLEAQGLELSGVQRQIVFTQGAYHDLYTYSLFGEDWRAKRIQSGATDH